MMLFAMKRLKHTLETLEIGNKSKSFLSEFQVFKKQFSSKE